jgi:hypothetical protein
MVVDSIVGIMVGETVVGEMEAAADKVEEGTEQHVDIRPDKSP